MIRGKNIEGMTLKLCRKYLGLKQKDLGKMLGFSDSTAEIRIAQYESGERKPKKETRLKMCDILGISEGAIKAPLLETEKDIVHILMHIDTLCGLKMKKEHGNIYIRFPIECNTIRYYLELLYRLKEMLSDGELEYDTYQYIKAAFGRYD
ncbi:MAG: helix-turn-helix transcriptional regulator [Clostridia bacterium]|nr:helix-turn-helix transcriptional regulator [Clostridia bacterium]